jgi:hypothetical protein
MNICPPRTEVDMLAASKRWMSGLTSSYRLAVLIFVIGVGALLIAFIEGGWKTGIPIGLLELGLIWLTKPLWAPSDSSKLRLALTSLALISSVALSVLGRAPEAKTRL